MSSSAVRAKLRAAWTPERRAARQAAMQARWDSDEARQQLKYRRMLKHLTSTPGEGKA